ncbi:DUF2066 domain-containing protein, partial [Zavarzinia sp.]|uniref:DUF2066 domain-containing protein n=1 Tax=Zavarzinia sp. TaxID=2027920 RepID=UPI0035646DCD
MSASRLLFRLLAAALFGVLALAGPAVAETYTVDGVVAQATGPDPLTARDAALTKAQRDALETLLKRLAAPGTEGSMPRVTDQLVFQTMQGFEVKQEKTTATSYSALLTVEFRGEAIDSLLAGAGVSYVEAATHPLAVIPLRLDVSGKPGLWEEDNEWRLAWARRNGNDDPQPLVVPQGDLADMQALSAQAALAGDAVGLGQVAQHYGASATLVATAQQGAGGIAVSVAEPGQASFYTGSFPVGAYDAAVTAAAAAIQDRYRSRNAVPAGPTVSLEAIARFSGLGEWRDLRTAIENTPAVKRLVVKKLVVGSATLGIDYQGDPASLASALSQRGVVLTPLPGGGYGLARGFAAPGPVPGSGGGIAPLTPL